MKTFNWKNGWSLFSILMLALASMTFIACSNDDDDNGNKDGERNTLVGTWRIDNEASEGGTNGTWFIFNSNGKGFEEDRYPGETDRWPITWSYNASEKTLTIVDVEDPSDTETDVYTVVSLSDKKMVLRIYDEDYPFVKVEDIR